MSGSPNDRQGVSGTPSEAVAMTERQRHVLRALAFFDSWTTAPEILTFLRDNGYEPMRRGGRRPIIGWLNTLRSLESRGFVEARSLPDRWRITNAGREA